MLMRDNMTTATLWACTLRVMNAMISKNACTLIPGSLFLPGVNKEPGYEARFEVSFKYTSKNQSQYSVLVSLV